MCVFEANWWHTVLNLDTTVAVTENFGDEANIVGLMEKIKSSRDNDSESSDSDNNDNDDDDATKKSSPSKDVDIDNDDINNTMSHSDDRHTRALRALSEVEFAATMADWRRRCIDLHPRLKLSNDIATEQQSRDDDDDDDDDQYDFEVIS